MIRISEPGPMMKEYAACFGCTPEEVLQWVLYYCNDADPQGTKEPTDKERLESIKGYIEAMVHDSMSRRIKREVAEEKKLKEAA